MTTKKLQSFFFQHEKIELSNLSTTTNRRLDSNLTVFRIQNGGRDCSRLKHTVNKASNTASEWPRHILEMNRHHDKLK